MVELGKVFVQECNLLGHKAFIVRAEKTIHKANILEIVSDINFRKMYNLQNGETVELFLQKY